MKKVYPLVLFLFLCGLPLSGNAQLPREAFIPEQFLPENTLAVCVFPNLQATAETFQQTRFFEALYSERHRIPSSAITPALKKIQQEFSKFAEEFRKNAGFRLSEMWTIFHNSITLALVDISPGEFEGTPRPDLQVAFIADVHDSAEALRSLIETIIVPKIQTEAPTVEFWVASFEGINMYGLANEQFQVYYTFLERAFVLTLDQQTIRKIISGSKPVLSKIAGNPQGNLFNAFEYRSVVGDVHEDRHEARIYLDIQNIWLKVRPYIHQVCSHKLTPENTFMLTVLDSYPLQSLFWTFSYKNKGGYERLFFRMKDQSNQAFDKNLVPSGGDETFTSDQIVPADVLYYGATRVNLPEIWRQFSALLKDSPYPQQIEHVNNWVKQVEDTFQVDSEHEFLAAFGREMAIVWHSGEFRRRIAREKSSLEDFPCLVLFRINDKKLLEHTFQNLLTMLQIEPHKEVYQNTEMQSFALPAKIAPYSVHTTFVKDFFAVSLSRMLLQELITTSQQGNSLATAADYRQLASYFPSRGYSKGYLNIAKLSGVLQRFLKQENGSESSPWKNTSALMLDLTILAEGLPGMMWVTTVVSDGFLTESFSPVGGTVTAIALTWLGWSCL